MSSPDCSAAEQLERLAAFRTIAETLSHGRPAPLADRLLAAQQRGWPHAVRALRYADLCQAWATGASNLADLIDALRVEAAEDNDPVSHALALALSSARLHDSPDGGIRDRADYQLTQASAQLGATDEGGALERVVAYAICGYAYSQRELWELVEEMFDHARELLAACEEPILDRFTFNARAGGFMLHCCALREAHEIAHMGELVPQALIAVEEAMRSTDDPALGIEHRVYRMLLFALADLAPPESVNGLRDELAGLDHLGENAPVLLYLAEALMASDAGDWAALEASLAVALPAMDDDETPGPMRALALALAADLDDRSGHRGPHHAYRYAQFCAQQRWRSRTQMLSSARARLEAERLRGERDAHAQQALTDELTGLGNRREFSQHLSALQARRPIRPVAVLMVDVDKFKTVNDSFGHPAGDDVLVRLARSLGASARPTDLIARIGGDEFVVVMADVDIKVATRRAGAILHNWRANRSNLLPGLLDVTVSIGIAVGSMRDVTRVVGQADEALYAAKALGGDHAAAAPVSMPGDEAPSLAIA